MHQQSEDLARVGQPGRGAHRGAQPWTGAHGHTRHRQSLDWLQWLAQRLEGSVRPGLGLSERLRLPDRFAKGAAQAAEFVLNVMGLYPSHELAQLQGRSVPTGTAR